MVLFVVVEVAVVAVICFFIGSINPAALLARARGQDLRSSGSGKVSPRYRPCGTVASTNFWRSSSFEKRLTFQRMDLSECWLSLSEGPNIINEGHHQRFSAP